MSNTTSSPDKTFGEATSELTALVKASFPYAYSPRQRFRDYNEVFLTTSAGRRVFYDLMQRSEYHESPVRLGDQDSDRLVFLRIGAANLMRLIFITMLAEPQKDPEGTAQTEKDETDAR